MSNSFWYLGQPGTNLCPLNQAFGSRRARERARGEAPTRSSKVEAPQASAPARPSDFQSSTLAGFVLGCPPAVHPPTLPVCPCTPSTSSNPCRHPHELPSLAAFSPSPAHSLDPPPFVASNSALSLRLTAVEEQGECSKDSKGSWARWGAGRRRLAERDGEGVWCRPGCDWGRGDRGTRWPGKEQRQARSLSTVTAHSCWALCSASAKISPLDASN